ncbi:MAG: hypothetical protein WBX01_08705 [Nitrososphaeraceae archaeon]
MPDACGLAVVIEAFLASLFPAGAALAPKIYEYDQNLVVKI